jgi:probable phosphoglycerate mutase
MTAGTVVLLRHGRTAWNVAERLQGQTDVELDDVGVWQAREAAHALARAHRATRIVASDLSRAVRTAAAYADLLGLDVVTDERLRERHFGDWEGLTRAEIAAGWPDDHAAWRRGDDAHGRPPGGETRQQVAHRVRAAIENHAAGLDHGDTLVVVSHGAAITLAITAMLGQEPTWRGVVGLTNAHWSQLTRASDGSQPPWRVVAHNVGAAYAPEAWHAGPQTGVEQDSDTGGAAAP